MNHESDKPDTQKHGLFFFGLPTPCRPTTEEMPRSAQEVRIQNLECVLYDAQHRVAERDRQITMMAERQKDLEEALESARKSADEYGKLAEARLLEMRKLEKVLQEELRRYNETYRNMLGFAHSLAHSVDNDRSDAFIAALMGDEAAAVRLVTVPDSEHLRIQLKQREQALAEEQKRHEVTQEYLDNVRKYETLYRIQQAECAPLHDQIKRLQAEIERLNLALKQKPNEDLLADNSRLHKQLAECQRRIEDLQSVKRALSAEQDYADRIGRILNDREESLDACHRKIEEQAKELEVLWKQRDDMLDRLCAVESALYAGVPPAKGAI